MNYRILGIVAVLLAVVGIFGRKAVSSHLFTMRQEVRDTVREATPGGYEVKRIQVLIQDMSRDVLAFGDKISDIESTAAGQRADIQKLEQQTAADRADLLAERNLLAQTGGEFVIRGAKYTRAQVEASAQARLARMQRDLSTAEAKKQAVERLDGAIREGRAQLQAALTARDGKIQELEVLSAELANAELQRDLQSLAAPLRDANVLTRSRSELADSLKAFSERVRDAKRQVQSVTEISSAPALIPHGGGTAGAGLVEQIDRVLNPAAHAPTLITNVVGEAGR